MKHYGSVKFAIGDKVAFKNDIEGTGIVAIVVKPKSIGLVEYAIRSESEPEGYPFHTAAQMNFTIGCMVVWVDEDHIWPL
jgi:hypothetical protein